ncbi:MAG: hypothetical protein HY401_05040 [Elusimicrobia bacterium]|nr:hypothetical protein [Elusimicrobiota bacterium]
MIWFLLYNVLSPFLLLGALLAACFSGRGRQWVRESLNWRALSQRLGLSGSNPRAAIAIHAASLGEARSLANFLKVIHQEAPHQAVHMTCMTTAGLQFIETAYIPKGWVETASLVPLDIWPAAALFFSKMRRLKVFILVETELWPNLIAEAKNRGLFLCLINGRLSEKTKKWLGWFPSLGRHLFGSFDAICLTEEGGRDYLKTLGVQAHSLTVTGNIKWDTATGQAVLEQAAFADARNRMGLGREEFLWVAASTREGEEEIVLSVFKEIFARRKELRLAIAPRHVERNLEVLKLAQAYGFRAVLLSRLTKGLSAEVPVVVVDEFGVLTKFYDAADGVFVGGTLVPKIGGHNFLEPAARGRPIAIGPYFENFKEVGEEFIEAQALVVARGAKELVAIMEGWVKNPDIRFRLGGRAKEMFQNFSGATQKTWSVLKNLGVAS